MNKRTKSSFLILVLLGVGVRASAVPIDFTTGPTLNYDGVRPPVDQIAFRTAAFNYMIHSVSWTSKVHPIDPNTAKGRQPVDFDLSQVLSPAQINIFRKKNPYDCTPDKTGPLRVDWMTTQFREDDYNRLIVADLAKPNATGLLEKLGVDADTTGPKWKKLLFAGKGTGKGQESRISVGERSLLVTEDKDKSPVSLTIDADLPQKGSNPFDLLGQVRAGEMIFPLPNGMDGYALLVADDDKKKLTFAELAPTNLVVNNFGTLGAWRSKHLHAAKAMQGDTSTIKIAHECNTCHRDGWVGLQRGQSIDEKQLRAILADRAAELPEAERAGLLRTAKNLAFLPAEGYEEIKEKRNKRFTEALEKTKSVFEDPVKSGSQLPVLAELSTVYDAKVTWANAAAELGTTEAILKDLVAKHPELKKKFFANDFVEPTDPTLIRNFFEKGYCLAKSLLPVLPPPPKKQNPMPRQKPAQEALGH